MSDQLGLFAPDPLQPVREWAKVVYGPASDTHHQWAVETGRALLDGEQLPPYPGGSSKATVADRVSRVRGLVGLEDEPC